MRAVAGAVGDADSLLDKSEGVLERSNALLDESEGTGEAGREKLDIEVFVDVDWGR